MKSLVLRCEELVKMQTQEKNSLVGPLAKPMKKSFEAILKILKKEIEKIEKKIAACIKQDEMMKEKEKVLPTIRRALFMAALSAVRYNDEMKIFYQRLRDNGKKPIVALTATARKLATIANARIRDMQLS